jgi:hypothetical protein
VSELDRAMGVAMEHAQVAEREGANSARCIEMRDDIDQLVGRWVDGRLVWPQVVADTAGCPRRGDRSVG